MKDKYEVKDSYWTVNGMWNMQSGKRDKYLDWKY